MIKKIIAIVLVLVLIVNFFAFMKGKIDVTIFWLILIIIFLITYFFFPKEQKIKRKNKKY